MQLCKFWNLLNTFSDFLLQRAGLVGVAGLCAARNAVEEFRCAAGPVSLRTVCVREQSKKAVPATLSPALVSPHVIYLGALRCRWPRFSAIITIYLILQGKERNRSQGLRAIVGLKRDNLDDTNHGVVATQTGELTSHPYAPWCS